MGFKENREALELALKSRGLNQTTGKAMFLREGAAGRLCVQDFTAPTGIGRFDAVYDPASMEYRIKARVKFNFISPAQDGETLKWDQTSIDAYKTATKKVVNENWSERYTIKCTRDGWTDLSAKVIVEVEETSDITKAHFQLDAKRLPTGARSQGGGVAWSNTPPTIDVDSMGVVPKYQQKLQENAFNMRERLMKETIIATKTGVIEFDHNSHALKQSEVAKLGRLANSLAGIIKSDVKGLKVYIYGATSGFAVSGRAKSRADAVRNWLKAKVPNSDEVFVSLTSLTKDQKAAALKSLQTHYNDNTRTSTSFSGCILFVATPEGTVREAETNYIVMVHEFGHVLGLPDEYTGRLHPRIAATKPLASILTDTMQQFDKLSGQKHLQYTDGVKRKDVRQAMQQGGFARMFEEQEGDIDMPLFTTGESLGSERDAFNQAYQAREDEIKKLTKAYGKDSKQLKAYLSANPEIKMPLTLGTSSIMYAGMEIMPAHYLPMWSSLCVATGRYLSPKDWVIDPTPLKG